MEKIERLKVNFEVSLGEKTVGTFTTLQKAKTAANVAELVAGMLGSDRKAKIKETAVTEEKTQAAA